MKKSINFSSSTSDSGASETNLTSINVTGKVVDCASEIDPPVMVLPGVEVRVVGTNIGSVTDANGVYAITVPSTSSVLKFSLVGYNTREITVGSKVVIDTCLLAGG